MTTREKQRCRKVETSSSSSDVAQEWSAALNERTAQVDTTVRQTAQCLLEACAEDVVVAAVGGYGRSELFPNSDIDLLIAARSEETLTHLKEPLSVFLRVLWDRGLRVSQSTRTVAECCCLNERNVELHISLLDLRPLAGSGTLFCELSSSLDCFYEKQRNILARRLAELTRSRHAKYNDTIFHLEPNIKETPGGIRDTHFLHWLTRLAPDSEALREVCREADDARSVLFPIRLFLHQRSNRDNNLLTFDLQDEAAFELGNGASPAEWMRTYFQAARQVSQATQRALEITEWPDRSLLGYFRDRRSRLSTTDYTVSRDRILLRNPAEVIRNAASIFRLFTFVAHHGIALAWDAKRRLRAEREKIAERVRVSPPEWNDWSELLTQPHAGLALREMQESGVLASVLPEWHAIDSLVVRDFYHRYTVDEHTFTAIGIIDTLATGSPTASKRFQEVWAEVDNPAVLRFALLLHDIGKGLEPGDHVRGSLDAVKVVSERFKIPEAHQHTIRFLIEHHLDLSAAMNSRDPDDPATARQVADITRTAEQLRYLALLTFADISAVNPTAMTSWRFEQLWRLYSIGQAQLTRELDTDRIHDLTKLAEENCAPELAWFLEGLPMRYLRTHSRADLDHHAQMDARREQKKVAVEIVPAGGFFQATVLAQGRPGLFAALCGTFASFGLSILKAEAFNNKWGVVVDQFRFADPFRNLELNPSEVERLRRTLERVVMGVDDVAALLSRRRRPQRPSRVSQIAPQVRFNNDASDTATLVEFIGEDRPGLLYDLASVFSASGCNIEIVLIDTEAHKAVDVFYVTQAGQKIETAMQCEIEARLMSAAGTG